jgi:hypothetical protein
MPSQVTCAKGTIVNLFGILNLSITRCCITELCNMPLESQEVFAKSSNKSDMTESSGMMFLASKKHHFTFSLLLISFIHY